MAEGKSVKCHVNGSTAGGMIWLMGWLFTLGYLHLPSWRGVLALLIWLYFLGVAVGGK